MKTNKQFSRIANYRRLRMLFGVFTLVGLVGVAKYFVHIAGFEAVKMSPLFSSLVASDVFLLGFLLSGVLQDYKESEKLPGELASAFEILALEIYGIPIATPGADVAENLDSVAAFCGMQAAWLRGNMQTIDLMEAYRAFHGDVVTASNWLEHSSLRARLFLEASNILRVINRIQVVRETTFVPLVYWLAYGVTTLLCLGLVLLKTDGLGETIFLNSVILFTFLFLLGLITDLDNPFSINESSSAEHVSICVLDDAHCRLLAMVNSSEGRAQGPGLTFL